MKLFNSFYTMAVSAVYEEKIKDHKERTIILRNYSIILEKGWPHGKNKRNIEEAIKVVKFHGNKKFWNINLLIVLYKNYGKIPNLSLY